MSWKISLERRRRRRRPSDAGDVEEVRIETEWIPLRLCLDVAGPPAACHRKRERERKRERHLHIQQLGELQSRAPRTLEIIFLRGRANYEPLRTVRRVRDRTYVCADKCVSRRVAPCSRYLLVLVSHGRGLYFWREGSTRRGKVSQPLRYRHRGEPTVSQL